MEPLMQSLGRRHGRLECAIRRELNRAAPDELVVQRLKKLKLAIKDRMASRQERIDAPVAVEIGR